MIEPIRIAFEVACEPDHAFRTWTARASSWWPAEHTASGEPGTEGSLTRVEIEHSGWHRLGEARGSAWRGVNNGGWDGVLPAYRAELQGGSG